MRKKLAKRPKRKTYVPFGTYAPLYRDRLLRLRPGQFIVIRAKGKVKLQKLQSLITGRACYLWGKGSVCTTQNHNLDGVEVFRFQ